MQLKQPDRIPIQLDMGYMLADMYGCTHQEQQESAEKEQEMLEKAALYFQPDVIFGVYNNPGASLAVGDRMTKFPGHDGTDPNSSFQFVEGEYMKAEDYDAFLDDPADWSIRKYWPRVFKELEGLAMLPPLGLACFGAYSLPNLGVSRRRPWQPPFGPSHGPSKPRQPPTRASLPRPSAWQPSALPLPPSRAPLSRRPSILCPTRSGACGASCSIFSQTGEAPRRRGKGPSLPARICHRL